MKYILFDLDGTLTDSKEGILKCVSYALEHFGIHRPLEELMCFVGPPLHEGFMQCANLSPEQAQRAVELYRERFAPVGIYENRVYPRVLEMLQALKNNGKILALATSKPQVFALEIIKRYGIEPYLTVSVGSELDATRSKKSEVIAEAMRLLGASKEETVMVGDRMHDIAGAKEIGIKSVGAGYGYAASGELEKAGADYIANSVEELTKLLLKL